MVKITGEKIFRNRRRCAYSAIIIAACLLFSAPAMCGQALDAVWQQAAAGEGLSNVYSVATDSSGNIYITGVIEREGNEDMFVAKYGTNGDTVWQRYYGVGEREEGDGIAVDDTGNVYVAGICSGASNLECLTVKYDWQGNMLWSRSYSSGYGGDCGTGIALDNSGNAYVAGYSVSAADEDILVLKYDPRGNIVWERKYDSGSSDYGYGIIIDGADNIYVTGQTGNGNADVIIIRYNSSGDTVWQKKYDNRVSDGANDIAVDLAGNVYIAGYSCDSVTDDYLIMKYNPGGDLLWQKVYDGGNFEYGAAIAAGPSGSVYMLCLSSNGAVQTCFTVAYDQDGETIWRTGYASGPNESVMGIAVDPSGNIYLAGQSIDYEGNCGSFVRKYSDFTPAAGLVAVNGSDSVTFQRSASLRLTADETQSGLICAFISNYADFSESTTLALAGLSVDTDVSWTLLQGAGMKTVYIMYKDNFGNTSVCSNTIDLKVDSPTGSVAIDYSSDTSSAETVVLSLPASVGQLSMDRVTISNYPDFSNSLILSYLDMSDVIGMPEYQSVRAFWKLDENSGDSCADSSGRGHTAAVSGAAAGPGIIGNGRESSVADSDYLSVPHHADLCAGADFTVGFWFRTDAAAGNKYIISKRSSENGKGWAVGWDPSTYCLAGWFYDSDNGGQEIAAVSSSPYNDDTWHYIVLVKSNKTAMLYVDATNIAAGVNNDLSDCIDTGDLFIFKGMAGGRGITGTIDEVAIWDVALAGPEVAFVYSVGAPQRQKGIVWDLISGSGLKTVYVKYTDSDSNVSSTYSDSIFTACSERNIKGSAEPDLSIAIAHPNPSREGVYVIFSRLTSRVSIFIYNIAGELARNIEKDDPADVSVWDLKNDSGEYVASGVYLCFLTDPAGDKKIIKVMVTE